MLIRERYKGKFVNSYFDFSKKLLKKVLFSRPPEGGTGRHNNLVDLVISLVSGSPA